MKLSVASGRPADAAAHSVRLARTAERYAMVGCSPYMINTIARSRMEWMWALVYLLEWVRRGREAQP